MSNIEWTDVSWNPIAGCKKVSPGCLNCYAERMSHRQKAMGHDRYLTVVHNGRWTGKVKLDEKELLKPLSWRKPRMIFVCSMSDLFQDGVPDEFIARVFAVMALCPQHTFQVLTKRSKRMAEIVTGPAFAKEIYAAVSALLDKGEQGPLGRHWDEAHKLTEWRSTGGTVDQCTWNLPLPNVWLGTSCEDQQRADERTEPLIQCPAAVRFLSCEPLLGPLRLSGALPWIDWVIVGAESGPGARACDVECIRSVVRQGKAAGVPVFVKQLGGHPDKRSDPAEWPEDLRVREFPKTGESK